MTGQNLFLNSNKCSENVISPNILVPVKCINFFHENIMVVTTCKSDIWEDIGSCLIALCVVELLDSEGLLIIFLRTSAGLFWLHIALNVVLKCQYFPQMVDFVEHPSMEFHCDFTVLLIVIFFFYLSSGTFQQWTLKLSSQWRNLFVYLKTKIFKLLC